MGRTTMRSILPLVLACAVVTGCGGPVTGAPPGGPDVIVPGGPGEPAQVMSGAEAAQRRAPVPVSPADVEFVTQMIPHHRQALEMTALVPTRAADPQVAALADRIAAAQGPEIAVLEAWLARQDADPHGGHHDPAHPDPAHPDPAHPDPAHPDPAHPMPGMATPEQIMALAASSGPAFDRLFVELMTAHHAGAIAMAEAVVIAGTDITVAELARDVVATQTVEIDRMRALLAS